MHEIRDDAADGAASLGNSERERSVSRRVSWFLAAAAGCARDASLQTREASFDVTSKRFERRGLPRGARRRQRTRELCCPRASAVPSPVMRAALSIVIQDRHWVSWKRLSKYSFALQPF